MRVLITGIAGFVGSSLCRQLINETNYSIVGVDDLSFGRLERCEDFANQIEMVQGTVQDFLRNEEQPFDLIINTAAIAPLPENQINHERSIATSLGIAASIIDFGIRTGSRKIIHISTSAVYEGNGASQKPSKETDEIAPHLMYPLSKFLVEQYFEQQSKVYGLDVSCIRLFNLFGPHQDYFRKQPPLLGYLLKSAIRDEPITIYSKGNAVRDYIYIDDLVDLINKLSEDFGNHFDVVNAGTGNAYNVNEIIKLCEKVTGKKFDITRGEPSGFWGKYPELFSSALPLPEQIVESEIEKNSIADNTKAAEKYGWQPKTSFETGLRLCFEHAKDIVK